MSDGKTVGERWPLPGTAAQKAMFIAVLVVLGLIAGLAPIGLPVKIILGLVAGIGLFVLIYSNIQIGLILFIALNCTLPQAGLGWDVGMQVAVTGETRGIHFNFHEIVIAMVFVAWIIQVFLKKADWTATSPMMIGIILYVLDAILTSFVGLLNSGSELIVIFRFTRTVLFAYIFFVFINNLKTRRQLKQLIVVVLICATLVAMFGLAQKVMGQSWAEMVSAKYLAKLGVPSTVNYVAGGEGEIQAFRITSTFLHPNVLGAYLILVLPFFISLLWYYKERWQRVLLLAGIAINVVCLFYTGSRASWVAGGAIALLYGVFGFMDKRMVLVLGVVALVVIVAVLAIFPPDFVKKRFSSPSATYAATARIMQYQFAIDFFFEHPILGIGFGMEGEYIKVNQIKMQWAAVENAFLTYLVSAGLLGLSIFLLLFVIFWGMMLFTRNNSPDDPFLRFHAEAFLQGTVGIAVASMFGAWLLFAIPMWTMFIAFLGMGSCLYNMYREESPATSYAQRKPVGISRQPRSSADGAGAPAG